MSDMPRVSVVMPVYNRAEQVRNAIESLLAQTYRAFELILVDDGSTDGSVEVMESYVAHDPRLRLLTLPTNGGGSLARAIGTTAAKGEFLAVMDSDDVAWPERLEKQVAYMDAHPSITLAGANAYKVMGEQRVQMQMPLQDGELKARLLLVDATFVHPTIIMRRDFLRQHNLNYSAERRSDDDYEFYNRLMQSGARFANMPDTVLDYHRHGGNSSNGSLRREKNKTPLRRYLLALFYPDLTAREVTFLAVILEKGRKLSAKDAYAGLLAAEKAMIMKQSQYGEDHQVLNAILTRYVERLRQALARPRSA